MQRVEDAFNGINAHQIPSTEDLEVKILKLRTPSRRMKTLFNTLDLSAITRKCLGMDAWDGDLHEPESLVFQPSFKLYTRRWFKKKEIVILRPNKNGDLFPGFATAIEQEMARIHKDMMLTAEQLAVKDGSSYAIVQVHHYMQMRHKPEKHASSWGLDYVFGKQEYLGAFPKREELPIMGYSAEDARVTNAFFQSQHVHEAMEMQSDPVMVSENTLEICDAVQMPDYDPLDLRDVKLVHEVEDTFEGKNVIGFQCWETVVEEPPKDVRKPAPLVRTPASAFIPYVKR